MFQGVVLSSIKFKFPSIHHAFNWDLVSLIPAIQPRSSYRLFVYLSPITNSAMGDISSLSIHDETTYQRIPFGKEMLKQFPFDPEFKNLNHGMQVIYNYTISFPDR
jgi:hypothetical protein